ncbi:MAG: hypothetical protein ACHQD9_00975 [Chitinophagales bacterium]
MKKTEEQMAAKLIAQSFDLPEVTLADEELANFRLMLIDKLNFLLDHDFEKLLWILYRIDVPEEKANQALAEKSDHSPAEILADLIIARQIEKAKTRLQYSSDRNKK